MSPLLYFAMVTLNIPGREDSLTGFTNEPFMEAILQRTQSADNLKIKENETPL